MWQELKNKKCKKFYYNLFFTKELRVSKWGKEIIKLSELV